MTPMLPVHHRFTNPIRRDAVAVLLMLLAMLFALSGTTAFGEGESNVPRPFGRFIRVALPITGQTFEKTRRVVRQAMDNAKKEKARLVLVLQFDVPPGQKDLGRGSEFGSAHDLAAFLSSEELNNVRTIAYVPESIEGHAVLPVLACQEIIMAKEATLGAAGIDDKTLTATVRSAYAEIAGRRRTLPTAMVLGMLDPAIEEFKKAMRDPERTLECCSMLSICEQARGDLAAAVSWLQQGILAPGFPPEDCVGLRYDLGDIYLLQGHTDLAMEEFKAVHDMDPDYRDVAARLA